MFVDINQPLTYNRNKDMELKMRLNTPQWNHNSIGDSHADKLG